MRPDLWNTTPPDLTSSTTYREMKEYDVVVVGGGAAGLSAALVLRRARRSVVLVDAGAPRNAPAERMHGFLSRDGVPPQDLLAVGRSEVTRYGGRMISDTVVSIEPGYRVRLANGPELTARRLIVATGLRDALPDIPGVRERWGRDLLHCPYGHGYEVRDQPLGVLGGVPDAVQQAPLIRQWSPDVTLFPHTNTIAPDDREKLTAHGIRIADGTVARLVVENDHLQAVELQDGSLIPRTAIFVRPRFVPNSDLLSRLGCEVDENGWIVHDPAGRTTVAGAWVVGNAADPRAQVITAAGEGSAAAIALNADLVDEDVNRSLAESRSSATPVAHTRQIGMPVRNVPSELLH
jgi:thioredoxin reductase